MAAYLRSLVRVSMGEGLRFLWAEPFLGVTTLIFGLCNFIGTGLVLTTIVIAERAVNMMRANNFICRDHTTRPWGGQVITG